MRFFCYWEQNCNILAWFRKIYAAHSKDAIWKHQGQHQSTKKSTMFNTQFALFSANYPHFGWIYLFLTHIFTDIVDNYLYYSKYHEWFTSQKMVKQNCSIYSNFIFLDCFLADKIIIVIYKKTSIGPKTMTTLGNKGFII